MAITPLPTPPSRSAPSTFSTLADAFLGALPTFVTEANAQAAALELNDTTDASASSVAIGTGAKTFVVTAGKSFQPGMSLMIADDAAPSTNWMHGQVTSYSGTTLVMNITAIGGSGTKTAWTITFSAPTGLPTATAESDMLFAAPTSFSWIKKTLAEAKTILGLLSNVPAATAESDFIVSGGSPFAWVKKTLLEVKALIGLVPQATGFTLAGGTSSKTLTVAETMTLTGYATAAEITTGTEAAKAIAPDQLALSKYNVGYATAAEITAGTEPAKAIAPDQLKAAGIGLIGSEMFWPTETPPAGWLEEDGASLVRATYPALFALIGTMYGAADGTHFNLPDMRGKFPRIWAHGQTTDPNKATRTAPAATGATIVVGDHVGTEQAGDYKAHTHNAGPSLGALSIAGYGAGIQWRIDSTGKGTSSTSPTTGGNETRPINTYRMMIIKAY